jgi:hypothetical protein
MSQTQTLTVIGLKQSKGNSPLKMAKTKALQRLTII